MVKRKAKKVCPYRVGNRVSKVEGSKLFRGTVKKVMERERKVEVEWRSMHISDRGEKHTSVEDFKYINRSYE